MRELFSVQEAAAIAEVPADTIRTALEKKSITPSSRRRTGKSVRHGFSVRDILLLKLLTEFPFPLAKSDKTALKELLVRGASTWRRWYIEGPDLVFNTGEITVIVQCKSMRTSLAHNLAAFRWGRQRIVSSPEVLSGEPVFQGTRIPLEHIAGLFRKGISEQEIAEDFPALNDRDLAYARIYSRMGAGPGRPRKPLQIRRKTKAA
jgi:uncharacterized protein (DUF433 family)